MADFPLVIADDLTGAAETAVAFLPRDVCILELPELLEPRTLEGVDVQVVDTDSRHLDAAEAAGRVGEVITNRPSATILKKVDSTLRGPIGAEAEALRPTEAAVIMAVALPALGRTVVDGVPLVGGTPLAHTEAWASEHHSPPDRVVDALPDVRAQQIRLDTVRSGRLATQLEESVSRGAVAVCDAQTDGDLDRIIAAGRGLGRRRGVRWIGSAGIAHAYARTLPPRTPSVADVGTDPVAPPGGFSATSNAPALFVIGTATSMASRQVAALGPRVHQVIALDPADLDDDRVAETAEAVAVRAAGRHTVIHLTRQDRYPARRSARLARALARVTGEAATSGRPLFLTGGETARAVLRELAVDALWPLVEWESGVVASIARDGRTVVTKPGGFGDGETLCRVADRLGVRR